MSSISPFLGGDPVSRVGALSARPALTSATPVTSEPPPAVQDGFQASSPTLAGPVAATSAVEATPSWTRRVAAKLGEWATMLTPTPIAVAVAAVNDVVTGGKRDSHFEYRRECASESAAQETFQAARQRLFNPNSWGELGPRLLPTSFELISAETRKPKEGAPSEGDFLKIKLPDPGPPVWVRIEEIKDSPDSARVVVRPSENPTKNNPGTIIHLFGEETTNVFELKREGNTVIATVDGRDETANMTGNLLQNAFAGARLAGAWMGAKKPQWNSFTHKLVDGPPKSLGMQLQGQVAGMAAYLGMMQPDQPKQQ